MDISENIIIDHLDNGFRLIHNHSKGQDVYSTRTIKGLKNAIGNLLHGFQPDQYDLYRKDEEGISVSGCKEPRPID